MSWWIQTKDKSGKRSVYSIDVNPLVFMLALALCVSLLRPKPLGKSESWRHKPSRADRCRQCSVLTYQETFLVIWDLISYAG